MAKKMGVPHSFHELEPVIFKQSVGFPDDWKGEVDDNGLLKIDEITPITFD